MSLSFNINYYFPALPQRRGPLKKGSCSFLSTPKPARICAVSPWLTLPGTYLAYDFYSLAKDKVFSFNKELPEDEADFVGSSHGWIARYENYHSKDEYLFLSDPISHRHINLPSLAPLTLINNYMHVNNVVISSPDPHHQNCRAVMTFCEGDLAFCCPSSSSNWTPFGQTKVGYCSVVYSTSQKLFFCLSHNDRGIEAWDLNNLCSPVMIPMNDVPWGNLPADTNLDLYNVSTSLAVAEESDELYQVRRYTASQLRPDGSLVDEEIHCDGQGFPYKTTEFSVYKYDKESREWEYMHRTLNGMSIFVGMSHGFALSVADYPGLKPDAIYFTDIDDDQDEYRTFGGHDMGIFDYTDNTISPCYYPCDYQSIRKITPVPFWFTPNLQEGNQYL